MQNAKCKMKNLKWLTKLVMLAVVLCLPKFVDATTTTNLLITDNAQRVIEVDPNHNIVYQYGQTGVSGSGPNQLWNAQEAIKMTNGHILIADDSNHRVIEVIPTGTSGGTIVWEYKGPGDIYSFEPVDVRKLANGNVLITNRGGGGQGQILEVTPIGTNSATVVWESGAIALMNPEEAEKRPGTPTGYYLIADTFNNRVIEVQAQGTSGGTIVWQYGQTGVSGSGTNQLWTPKDALRLIGNTILICDASNNRVIEVRPTGTSGGTIVWECSANTGLPLSIPKEAIRLSNGNTLIADEFNKRVIEVTTSDYPSFSPASILWEQKSTDVYPWDVEELGIVNIARADYQDSQYKDMPPKFAGIVVPLRTPTVNLPEIKLSKTVLPEGPQQIGATLTYTISYENKGFGTAKNVVITDMVPDGTEYVLDSAQVTNGPSATIEYSHDGGVNFDGSQSKPVTHIRWSIAADVAQIYGFGGLQFQVVIK